MNLIPTLQVSVTKKVENMQHCHNFTSFPIIGWVMGVFEPKRLRYKSYLYNDILFAERKLALYIGKFITNCTAPLALYTILTILFDYT